MAEQAVIGLIGGMSWESSAQYYRLINEGVRDRLGGVAAMLFFLCLAAALATGVAWVGDVRLATGTALWVGIVALAAALVLKRAIPPPPAPPPVEPKVLQQRLDTDDAREGADKYTRE